MKSLQSGKSVHVMVIMEISNIGRYIGDSFIEHQITSNLT